MEVYRVGYCPTDTVETPIATIEVPETIINDKNKNGFHDYEIVISGNQMESMSIAVSYTHLDVYKRQNMHLQKIKVHVFCLFYDKKYYIINKHNMIKYHKKDFPIKT